MDEAMLLVHLPTHVQETVEGWLPGLGYPLRICNSFSSTLLEYIAQVVLLLRGLEGKEEY